MIMDDNSIYAELAEKYLIDADLTSKKPTGMDIQ